MPVVSWGFIIVDAKGKARPKWGKKQIFHMYKANNSKSKQLNSNLCDILITCIVTENAPIQ